MFDVEFTSSALNAQDRVDLDRCLINVYSGSIEFHVSIENGKRIIPIDALRKLDEDSKEKPSDLNVNILNETGSIIGSVVYKKCNFNLNMNNFLLMDRHSGSYKSVCVSFSYEKITYNQKDINI